MIFEKLSWRAEPFFHRGNSWNELRKKVLWSLAVIYLVPQTPRSSYTFGGPWYRENGPNSKAGSISKVYMKYSYPLARKVTPSSLKIISSLKLHPTLWQQLTVMMRMYPKNSFFGHFGVYLVFDSRPLSYRWRKIGIKIALRQSDSKFSNEKIKNNRKSVIFWVPRVFPILRTPKCIEIRWYLGQQVNHLQTSWNFFSRLISWIDTVKKWFCWIWGYWGKRITLSVGLLFRIIKWGG